MRAQSASSARKPSRLASPRASRSSSNNARGSRARKLSRSSSGTTPSESSPSECPRTRPMAASTSVGPPPPRARSTARSTTSQTAATSWPSTRSPSMPYPIARLTRPLRSVLLRRRSREGVAVVLDDDDERRARDCGHVEAFVKVSGRGTAVADERESDSIGPLSPRAKTPLRPRREASLRDD